MSIIKDSSPITVTDGSISTNISTVDVDNLQKKKVVNGTSTQMQLLGLAKQFALEGALISPEKQLPVYDRTEKRERLNQIRKQLNLENIIHKALSYSANDEVTDRADPDWFNNFLRLCENVSNKTMQELWAKILATEVAHPGSFSLKSLRVFKNMSINDAKLLAKACGLAVKDGTQKNMRIISGAYQLPSLINFFKKNQSTRINLSQHGLNYADILTLADNDLLFVQETESKALAHAEELHFFYNGKPLSLSAKKKHSILSFYKFTPIGYELAQLIANDPQPIFFAYLKQQLESFFTVKG